MQMFNNKYNKTTSAEGTEHSASDDEDTWEDIVAALAALAENSDLVVAGQPSNRPAIGTLQLIFLKFMHDPLAMIDRLNEIFHGVAR